MQTIALPLSIGSHFLSHFQACPFWWFALAFPPTAQSICNNKDPAFINICLALSRHSDTCRGFSLFLITVQLCTVSFEFCATFRHTEFLSPYFFPSFPLPGISLFV